MILKKLIRAIGFCLPTDVLQELMKYPCKEYEKWLNSLPTDTIPGLHDACESWIHSWGNGGGDYSTETCIREALGENETDIPREIAEIMFGSVSGYCQSPFEASTLIMTLMDECISEISLEESDAE